MKLIRYNPIQREVWTPIDQLNSLRDLFDSAFALASSVPGVRREWLPSMDVMEDEHKITVLIDSAGMKKEDFDISLEKGSLTIAGERKQEKQDGESFRTERSFGSFRRTIALPSPVVADQISANYRDGTLTIELPKAEEAKPKKIEVGIL